MPFYQHNLFAIFINYLAQVLWVEHLTYWESNFD